jgi:hypothetical protein
MTHTKDEALKLALEALLINCGGNTEGIGKEAITAIKQARSAPVQEPVAVDCCANCLRPEHEHQDGKCPKPFTTVWHAWDYDFPPDAPPAAQPATVQEPIYQMQMMDGKWIDQAKQSYEYNKAHGHTVRIVYTTPPAAQPAPVPLTDEQINKLRQQYGVTSDGRGIKEFTYVVDFARAIEAAHGITKGQP